MVLFPAPSPADRPRRDEERPLTPAESQALEVLVRRLEEDLSLTDVEKFWLVRCRLLQLVGREETADIRPFLLFYLSSQTKEHLVRSASALRRS